nr:hypothetical protein [Tanacetum cinerariifolium]
MLIPKELIIEAIQQSPYYQQYLEMATQKPTAKESVKKNTVSLADKSKKPAPAKQTKLVKEKTTKPSLKKKIRKGKSAIREHVLETTRQVHVVEDKGKGIATVEQAAQSLLDLHKPKMKIRDTPSPVDAESGADLEKTNSGADTEVLNVGEEQDHVILKKDQARSNPGQSHVALVGPNPEPMHEDFLASVYPKVHKSLKHTTEEQVLIENPLSSTRILSSMKNLEDNFTFGDQFINNKPTEEDPGKTYVETKVESMVTVPIHQASSSVPPLSIHVIHLTPLKHVSFTVQEPVFIVTLATTTLLSHSRVIPHSIHSDDGNPTSANIKQALRAAVKPCQGDSFESYLIT